MKKQVTAAIITQDNHILITQRSANGSVPLKWEFPGGKIEPHETPEACLIRELKEELDIVAEIQNYFMTSLYDYEFGTIELLCYFAKIHSGEIKLNVHNDYKWVTTDDLSQYDFAPADIPVVEALGS